MWSANVEPRLRLYFATIEGFTFIKSQNTSNGVT